MKQILRTSQFKKDFKLSIKRGKNQKKFIEVLELLISGLELPQKYKNHKLIGNYSGSQELHIEPDWLLIYRNDKNSLILERIGTHSDLFE